MDQTTKPTPKGLAITSLVVGIVALVLSFFWFIAIPLAITALILGIISLAKHHGGKGMSITGLITGGVALISAPFWIFVWLVSFSTFVEEFNKGFEEGYQQSQSQTEPDAYNFQ